MQAILSRDTVMFLNFLQNRYNIAMRKCMQTRDTTVYIGELRCSNGTLAVVKLKIASKGNSFVVYDRNKREIYQCITLNTEGRTKQFLDRLMMNNTRGCDI